MQHQNENEFSWNIVEKCSLRIVCQTNIKAFLESIFNENTSQNIISSMLRSLLFCYCMATLKHCIHYWFKFIHMPRAKIHLIDILTKIKFKPKQIICIDPCIVSNIRIYLQFKLKFVQLEKLYYAPKMIEICTIYRRFYIRNHCYEFIQSII